MSSDQSVHALSVLDLHSEILQRIQRQFSPPGDLRIDRFIGTPGTARATAINVSGLAQKLSSVKYDSFDVTAEPPAEVDRVDYSNDTATQQSQTFQVSETVQLAETWSVTRGLQVGLSAGVNIDGYQGGASIMLSTSETNSKTRTQAHSWQGSVPVVVPPHSRVELTLLLNELAIDVGFLAEIELSGSVGFLMAADGIIFPDDRSSPLPLPYSVANYPIGEGSLPLGHLFERDPHPLVSVVDPHTIHCGIEGRYKGVQGRNWQVQAKQFDLDSKDRPPAVSTIVTTSSLHIT
jgi:hypothetical protein